MIQFLVHDHADSVGVATQDIKAKQTVSGLFMDSQQTISIVARQDIPLGHKIALRDHDIDSGVIKYCEDIGRVAQRIAKGEHVHIHNLKTRRW